MKTLFIVLLTVCSVCVSKAQLIDTGALKSFDAGIVSRVFSIAKHTKLSKQQQIYLANYYKITDSITKAWIIQGKPVDQIDSLQSKSNRIFYELSNVDETRKAEFSFKNAERFASVASKGEMDYITEEYKPGNAEHKIIQQWLNYKYNFIYQRYLMNPQDPYSAKQSSQLYDLYNLFPALYSNKFISDYLEKLNGIRKIHDSTQLKVRNAFLNAIKANKYSDWSKTLLNITRSFLPDTSLFSKLYGNELKNDAFAYSAIDRYNLINIQHVSLVAFNNIYPLVLEKNYKNALLQYTYGNFNNLLVDSLVSKTSIFYDSLIKASLLKDGSLQPATQFAIALKYKEFLKIESKSLIDSLVYHAMVLSKKTDSVQLSDPFVTIDFGAYESEHLSRLLSYEQYTNLLMVRNKTNAYVEAKKNWADLEKRRMIQGLNKEKTIEEFANYYIARFSAWNRLAHDPKKQAANLRMLDEIRPQMLKALDAANWSNESEQQANSLQLKW